MRLGLILGLALMALCAANGAPDAQQSRCVFPRADEVNPSVSATVVKNGGRFDYSYSVTVLADSPKPVSQFAVAASSTDNTPTLLAPLNWLSVISPIGYYAWGVRGQAQGIPRGSSLSGFRVTTSEPPGIVRFLARNRTERPTFPRGEAPETCENAGIVDNSFKGSTVGPQAPPSESPVDLVNHLISLLDESRRLHWIATPGAHQDLLARLEATKRTLASGDTATARGALQTFLDEVSARSCPAQACPGSQPINSSAYAVLFFNAQALLRRL